ncbi:MAG: hypothetical protein AAF617_12875 [Bacteroidota bacterium]
MTDTKITVIWSDHAKADLRFIYERILHKTKSQTNSNNVKSDIIQASKQIKFIKQYQVDEFLGEPYRRMIVRHFKIVYVPKNNTSIYILKIFDLYRNPQAVKDEIE